jgi:hypothetical protein
LTVNTTRADLDKYLLATTDPRGECTALSQLFQNLASGSINGSVIAQKAATAAVKASGTITLVYAKLVATDTVTIAGITITCVTGTPSGFTEFKKVTDLATTAANLAAAINGLATLKIYCSATAAAGVVTVTLNQPGIIGNVVTLAKSSSDADGITVSAATFAGGTGGYTTGATTYSRGL